MRSFVLLTAAMMALPVAAQAAQTGAVEENLAAELVEIIPTGGTRLVLDARHYRGKVTVSGHSGGLAVTELTSLDGYLQGILEVPFSWPTEALRAQAVAARTYLAWTLDLGRSSTGRRYGYDICATTACQVYAGVDAVESGDGDRWRAAVGDTTGEILIYQGSPAQALYSSTSGGRTRSVEDVFGTGSEPYLVAVESPGEDSPFVEWVFELSQPEMTRLLDEAGLLEGGLVDVETTTTDDGAGPWIVTIEGTEGTRRIGTWELRSELNAAAPVLPDRLPALRPDTGAPYPQTILSPTFTIESRLEFIPPLGGRPPQYLRSYRVEGRGWGHLVGMSQYGAEAMASRGSGYAEILGHFYGGLQPTPATGMLPAEVVVGLATELDELEVGADGPITISLDGEVVGEGVLGTWRFEATDGMVRVFPPVGLGLPPGVSEVEVEAGGRQPVALTALLATSAEVRVLTRVGEEWRPVTDWEVRDAGRVRWSWAELDLGTTGPVSVRVEARSPEGEAAGSTAWVPGAE